MPVTIKNRFTNEPIATVEDTDDLIEDLRQALEATNEGGPSR
jgi:hypothetical protein